MGQNFQVFDNLCLKNYRKFFVCKKNRQFEFTRKKKFDDFFFFNGFSNDFFIKNYCPL